MDGLTPKQTQFLHALFLHPTLEKAAQHAGISSATARRWRQQPAFTEAYATLRRDAFQHAILLMQQGMEDSAIYLRDLIRNTHVTPSARIAAIRLLWEMSYRGYDTEVFEARLTALEATIAAQKAAPYGP